MRRVEHARRTVADALRAAPSGPSALLAGVPGLLRQTARRFGERPGLRTLEATLSWAEVDAAVDAEARRWRARGVGAGQAVALVMHNRLDGLVAQLGLARAGAVAAPVGPERRGPPLAHVLRAIDPAVVLADADGAAALATVEGWSAERIEARAPPPPGRPVLDPVGVLEAPYLLLATSGTTGRPKAARLPHRRVLLAGMAFASVGAHLRPDDVVFTPLPWSHASAQLAGLAAALWSGACFAFTPRFSTARYWRDARALGATVGLYVGEIGRYLADAPPDPDARRHRVHTLLGNGLAADVWPRLQARSGVDRIVEFYGATEGNTLLVNTSGKVGSVGRPAIPSPGLMLARYDVEADALVRDARGRCVPCAPGEPGELLVRISRFDPIHRFDGYRDAEATAAKIARGVRWRGDRWFRTGDLLRRDADGDWFFVDRVGDTFRWKGHNVSTQAVSEALAPAIAGPLAVYGVALPHREGRAGMLAVAGPPDLAALHRAAAGLPAHARPLFVRRVAQIAHTATRKVQKAGLRAEGLATDDPIWVWTPSGYTPLTAERRRAIEAGEWR